MNKVVTIHLDGIAYQLEEGAFDALRAYLDAANAKLSTNPDKDEIVKDLEQAIGAKLSTHLTPHKNVVTAADVDIVIAEMGPVAAEGESQGDATQSTFEDTGAGQKSGWAWPHNKRLYRISEGRVIAGVCTGLAAYFNVDVTLVRILFVLFSILTHGWAIIIYIVMMLIVPRARTPKEYEWASGIPPITAQELVDRAKKSFNDFKASGEWDEIKNSIKGQSMAWKHQRRAWKKAQKSQRYAYRTAGLYGQPKTFLSELSEFVWSMFGLFVILFCIWFLYHHVGLVQQFIDFVHATWDAFFYQLAQVTGNH